MRAGPASSPGGYLPISDYGAIGNLHSVALVGRNGSIDWCCLPELDSASIFAALLDSSRGGRFRVAPRIYHTDGQRYLPETNVLETTFESDEGRLTVTDFMPLVGKMVGRQDPQGAPEIHRLIRCREGRARVDVEWSPRFDYGRGATRLSSTPDGAFATSGLERALLAGLPERGRIQESGEGQSLLASFEMESGEEVALVCRYGASELATSASRSGQHLQETAEAWRSWLNHSVPKGWAGRWSRQVVRSVLLLKLLTHPDSGAIAAAPTTSLPEVIGGVRNWDYRFCWIRDAAMTVRALLALGHSAEAKEFVDWAERTAEPRGDGHYQIHLAYGLHGETEYPEVELGHLHGYRGSRPVRIGNGVEEVWEHDTYAELLGAAYELRRHGEHLDDESWAFLPKVADEAVANWREPDYGIWEFRNGPKHFVHSKWMVWVALDRAVKLAEEFGLEGDVERWRAERDAVKDDVLQNGWDDEMQSFVLHYGSKDLDAANLLMPLLGFLPVDDSRVQATIDRTRERLCDDGLVYRYRAEDGLPGREGAFVVCSFWLVDALAYSGRVAEARELFDRLAERANHVGLYSEEIDPKSAQFLGNFPQGLSHIGFINSALYLAAAEGRSLPSAAGDMSATSGGGDEPGYDRERRQNERRVKVSEGTGMGKKRWAIAEGYIPDWSNGPEPEMTSHETVNILNTSDSDANVAITIYFADREPAGPYRVRVGARRTSHLRFNSLEDPEPIPRGTEYASVIESDVPIVVQHTRLDSRQAENALLTTIAYSE